MDAKTAFLISWLHVFSVVVLADVWKVNVENEMKALVSSCVVLPCSFKYPGAKQPSARMRGSWHKNKKDEYIFNEDPNKIVDDFKGRTKLVGQLGAWNCSLEIDEIKNHDNGPFCFRIELETSDKNKYSFTDNCVSIDMIEKAEPPKLDADRSVQEGHPATFKCSVRHTCPSHQPTLTWSHSGKEMVTYKDIGHGNWEVESILTFAPTKEDDHTDITCTVQYHKVQGKHETKLAIFVKEQATFKHILIPTLSGLGAALLVGGLCFFMVKRYKNRIAELQSGNGMWSRLSRMSRRFRSGRNNRGPDQGERSLGQNNGL